MHPHGTRYQPPGTFHLPNSSESGLSPSETAVRAPPRSQVHQDASRTRRYYLFIYAYFFQYNSQKFYFRIELTKLTIVLLANEFKYSRNLTCHPRYSTACIVIQWESGRRPPRSTGQFIAYQLKSHLIVGEGLVGASKCFEQRSDITWTKFQCQGHRVDATAPPLVSD